MGGDCAVFHRRPARAWHQRPERLSGRISPIRKTARDQSAADGREMTRWAVDQHQISALATGGFAAIGQPAGPCRMRRDQWPEPGQPGFAVCNKPGNRRKHRRIKVIRCQRIKQTDSDHFSRIGRADMAAAARNAGGAKNNHITSSGWLRPCAGALEIPTGAPAAAR